VHVAPDWWDPGWDPYAVAIAGVKRQAGEPPALAAAPRAAAGGDDGRVTPARLARFVLGSLAGAAFIPVALWFRATRGRAARRRSRSATRP
jgi:hypothetical protein